jgi:hypothetical protein
MKQLLAGRGLNYINVGWLDKRYRLGLALEPIRGPGVMGSVRCRIIREELSLAGGWNSVL